MLCVVFCFFKQKTAYEMRISDWSSDVCSSDLRAKGLPLASHDDATAEHVAEAAADGMVVAEFPTTHEAAELSRRHGMKVMMGGPNVVRGGSHSGNISAKSLAEKGQLDIIDRKSTRLNSSH